MRLVWGDLESYYLVSRRGSYMAMGCSGAVSQRETDLHIRSCRRMKEKTILYYNN